MVAVGVGGGSPMDAQGYEAFSSPMVSNGMPRGRFIPALAQLRYISMLFAIWRLLIARYFDISIFSIFLCFASLDTAIFLDFVSFDILMFRYFSILRYFDTWNFRHFDIASCRYFNICYRQVRLYPHVVQLLLL